MLSRSLQEGRRQIVQLGVARVQIVAQPQVKRETPGNLPIVLEKESVLPVAKVPDTGCQPRGLTTHKAGIDTSPLVVGLINGEEQLVEKVVGRSPNVQVAVLYVPPNLHPSLQTVFAVAQGDQVHIVVDVFVKDLRVSVVRTEANAPVIEFNVWHTRKAGLDMRGRFLRSLPGTHSATWE